MRLMQSIANNKIKHETTLPATTVIDELWCIGKRDQCANERGEVMLYHLWNRWTTSHI